jgi:hypothetical protein
MIFRQLLKRFFGHPRALATGIELYLDEIQQSGLVSEETLQRIRKAIRDSPRDDDIDQLFLQLKESGEVNSWHIENLRRHKYRGYFLDQFRLLGHLRTTDRRSYFAAIDPSSHSIVEIEVVPKKFTQSPDRMYTVVGTLNDWHAG